MGTCVLYVTPTLEDEEVEKKEEKEETSKLMGKSEEAYPDNLEKIC